MNTQVAILDRALGINAEAMTPEAARFYWRFDLNRTTKREQMSWLQSPARERFQKKNRWKLTNIDG